MTMINSKADLNRAVANALHPKPPASERRAIHESKVWRWICPGDYPPGSDRDALGRFGHWEPADFCGELERVYLAATPGDWSIPHIADDTTKCNCVYVLSEGYAGSVCDISVGDGLSVSDGGNRAGYGVDRMRPDLTNRMAKCGIGCAVMPSSTDLPFFEFRGEGSSEAIDICKRCHYHKVAHERINPYTKRPGVVFSDKCTGFDPQGALAFDYYYCGCRGWD